MEGALALSEVAFVRLAGGGGQRMPSGRVMCAVRAAARASARVARAAVQAAAQVVAMAAAARAGQLKQLGQ